MYDVFKAGAYLNDIPHTFSSNAYTPYTGSGGNRADGDVPAVVRSRPALSAARLEPVHAGLRPARRRRLRRVAEEQPVVLPRRRQPGDVQRHEAGSGGQRHEPGQRLRRPRDPDGVQDQQLGRRRRLPVGQGDVRRCAGTTASSTTRTARCCGRTRTSAAHQTSTRRTSRRTTTFNKFTVTGNYRDLPWRSVISARYTWAKTTSDAHLAPYALNTRADLRHDAAEREQLQRREHQPVVRAGVDGAARPRASTRASTTTGRSSRTTRTSSSTATRRRTPLASGLGCGNLVRGQRHSDDDRRQLRQRDLQLHEEQRRLRRVVEVRARPPAGLRLGLQRPRPGRASTTTSRTANKLWVEYKNTMLDTLSARLKYQYVKRDSTPNFSNDPLPDGGANNPNYLLPYTSAFDLQSSTTNHAQALPRLEPDRERRRVVRGQLGKIDFDDVTYGRTSNDRQGYFLSGYWSRRGEGEAERVRQLGGDEVSVEPPLHRHRVERQRHGPEQLAAGMVHDEQPELLQPVPPPASLPASRNPTTGTRRPRTRRG